MSVTPYKFPCSGTRISQASIRENIQKAVLQQEIPARYFRSSSDTFIRACLCVSHSQTFEPDDQSSRKYERTLSHCGRTFYTTTNRNSIIRTRICELLVWGVTILAPLISGSRKDAWQLATTSYAAFVKSLL